MATVDVVGRVCSLWRFPVKSMRGERLERVALTKGGLPGDRAFGLIEGRSGKVVSAKNVTNYRELFACRALFEELPRAEATVPPVRITLPDGQSLSSDGEETDDALTAFLGVT